MAAVLSGPSLRLGLGLVKRRLEALKGHLLLDRGSQLPAAQGHQDRGGVYFAANNLNQYYTKGDEDIIAPQPEKAKGLWKIGAECGHPLHQSFYADELKEAERYEVSAGTPRPWA